MVPVPIPKSVELVETAILLKDSYIRDEFALKRLEIEARKLLSSDAAMASQVLGMVACLNFDIDETIHWFDNAMRHDSDNMIIATNYAIALSGLYIFDKEELHLINILERDRSNVSIVKYLVQTLKRTGQFHSAKEIYYRSFTTEEATMRGNTLDQLCSFMDRYSLNEGNLRKYIDATHDYLRGRAIGEHGYEMNAVDNDIFPCIEHIIPIARSERECMEIDIALAAHLAKVVEPTDEACYYITEVVPCSRMAPVHAS